MKSHFLRHFLKTYAVQLAFTFLQALIAVITARLLGPLNKGVLSLLSVMLMMAVILGRCGLGNAVIHFCGRQPAAAVVYNGFLLTGMIGMATALLALPVAFLLRQSLLRGVPAAGLFWLAAMVPVMFLFDYFTASFLAVMQIHRRHLLFLLHPLLQLVLLVVTVGMLRLGLAGALFSLSAALAVGVGWSIQVFKHESAAGLPRVDTGLMKQLLRFGLKSHIGGVMEVMSYRADFFLVNSFLGPAAVGFYSVAVNLAEIVWRLPEAVVLVLMPKVARMNDTQANEFTPRVCRLILFPVLAICLLLLLLGRFLILLFFGSVFMPAVYPLYFLLPGFIAFAVWKILSGDLVARGHPLIYSATSAAAFAVMVLLDVWLIPTRGIAGAAWASSIAYLLAFGLILIIYRRLTDSRWRDLLIPKKDDFRLLGDHLALMRIRTGTGKK